MGTPSNIVFPPQSPFFNALRDLVEIHDVSQRDIAVARRSGDSTLRAAMRQHSQIWGISSPHLEAVFNMSAGLVENAYDLPTFEEKRLAALYAWYMIYSDEASTTAPQPFAAFESRFIRGAPQLDPVLDALASVLHTIYDIYPTFYANSIINSSLQYMNSLSIERELELEGVPPSTSANSRRFPWFLRQSTGVSIAFALLLFPKTVPLEVIPCFKAQPDMDFWISATNDMLSYYKERIAGENANYICNRARAESKSQLEVISDLTQEVKEARENIYDALKLSSSVAAVETWRHFERGYISCHFAQTSRYKLDELYGDIFGPTDAGKV